MDEQTLKEYSKEAAEKLVKALSGVNKKELKGDGEFEVVATNEGVDRDGEVILIKGWDFKNFLKNPVVLFGHDYLSMPIGSVTELREENGKVIAKGMFARTEIAQTARSLYDDGFLKAVSVGFIPKEREGNVITKAELLELSFVPVPSNPDALDARKAFDKLENMLKTSVKVEKVVEPYKPTDPAPEDQEWDGADATAKLKEWASDEEGEIDYSKYKQGFTWFDSEEAEKQGAYKLPHHTVVGDRLTVVWQGVAAAMAALLGARGGVDIPDAEMQGVYNHLAKHYEQFEKEPPEFKSYTQYEIDNMFPELKKDEVSEDQKEALNYIIKTLKSDVDCLLEDAVENVRSLVGEQKESAEPTTKAGRTLSSKTRSSINNAVEAMGKAIESLKELLESADASDDDGKAKEPADKKLLKGHLKDLQGLDKVVEKAIVSVKERIKQ